MIQRPLYWNEIEEFIDKPLVKVITGIRRCGKSVILQLISDAIKKRGIAPERIIFINLESLQYSDIRNAEALYGYIRGKIKGKAKHYIFLDEIQEAESWERCINSLLADFRCDIYISGSNSKLLSSELATYLAGSYIELHIQTLSFREYLLFKKQYDSEKAIHVREEFLHYLRSGGFPLIHTGIYSMEAVYQIIYDVYSSVILRDTIQRHKIRDIELLERVVKFIFDNIGSKFSGKSVADYFKSQMRKVDINTVYNYINALESAYIIYRVPRYDIKGKEILKTQEKFYTADHSILYAVMGYRDHQISGILENIVMHELLRRNYNVFTGKSGVHEIDFIGERKNKKVYVQVAYKMTEKKTIEREFRTLTDIKDHYPKFVVSMDELFEDNVQGVRHIHIADFLLLNDF